MYSRTLSPRHTYVFDTHLYPTNLCIQVQHTHVPNTLVFRNTCIWYTLVSDTHLYPISTHLYRTHTCTQQTLVSNTHLYISQLLISSLSKTFPNWLIWLLKSIQIFHFQSNYCENLVQEGLECPTKDDFDHFDQDKNGVLTWSEWVSYQ